MIELTQEQRQELETGESVVSTNTTYVLVRKDVYDRIKSLLNDEDWTRDAYQAAMEVFARDGWDDPRMDVYDELDPRRAS
jgi:ribosome recycling factor